MATKKELTSDEIKHVAGWNEVTFELNLTRGLKKFRTGNDLYDAREFFLWYKDNIYRPMLSGDSDEDLDLDVSAHRARYEKARAQKYQIKLDKLRSQYVMLEDAEFALMELCGVFAELAESLPEILADAVHGQNEDTMLVKTDQIVRAILLEYSKLGSNHEGS